MDWFFLVVKMIFEAAARTPCERQTASTGQTKRRPNENKTVMTKTLKYGIET